MLVSGPVLISIAANEGELLNLSGTLDVERDQGTQAHIMLISSARYSLEVQGP
jgi:hypothetical protein